MGQLARQRRHTLYFLRYAQAVSPVFLDTDVDMTAVEAHRAAARAEGSRNSLVSYVLIAASRVVASCPDANSAIGGGLVPQRVQYDGVDVKLAVDKTMAGQRVVASLMLPAAHTASLGQVQSEVDRFRDTPAEDLPELAGLRVLQRLPAALGWLAFRLTAGGMRRRRRFMGTVAVSSLGHLPVNGFHAVGGTAVTFNVGQMRQAAVVRDGRICVAPVLRLNMAFDHRAIDGATAAELLTEVKDHLERWSEWTTVDVGTEKDVAVSSGSVF